MRWAFRSGESVTSCFGCVTRLSHCSEQPLTVAHLADGHSGSLDDDCGNWDKMGQPLKSWLYYFRSRRRREHDLAPHSTGEPSTHKHSTNHEVSTARITSRRPP